MTCLPGCFTLYRLKSIVRQTPILIHNSIITEYKENLVDTLHKRNLLALGEDRFLTTLMLKYFPTWKNTFTPDATCYTVVPETFMILLSQRRRWINSTVHNLWELILIPKHCGFCIFSMRFLVMLDLFSTLTMPAALGYLAYLVYKALIAGTAPVVPLVLIAAVYGMQSVLFLTRQEFQHFIWMIISILGMPFTSLAIPLYSFWHFDDFSWGNTRKVAGAAGGNAHTTEGDEFDTNLIPLLTWNEYVSGLDVMSKNPLMEDIHSPTEFSPDTAVNPIDYDLDPYQNQLNSSLYTDSNKLPPLPMAMDPYSPISMTSPNEPLLPQMIQMSQTTRGDSAHNSPTSAMDQNNFHQLQPMGVEYGNQGLNQGMDFMRGQSAGRQNLGFDDGQHDFMMYETPLPPQVQILSSTYNSTNFPTQPLPDFQDSNLLSPRAESMTPTRTRASTIGSPTNLYTARNPLLQQGSLSRLQQYQSTSGFAPPGSNPNLQPRPPLTPPPRFNGSAVARSRASSSFDSANSGSRLIMPPAFNPGDPGSEIPSPMSPYLETYSELPSLNDRIPFPPPITNDSWENSMPRTFNAEQGMKMTDSFLLENQPARGSHPTNSASSFGGNNRNMAPRLDSAESYNPFAPKGNTLTQQMPDLDFYDSRTTSANHPPSGTHFTGSGMDPDLISYSPTNFGEVADNFQQPQSIQQIQQNQFQQSNLNDFNQFQEDDQQLEDEPYAFPINGGMVNNPTIPKQNMSFSYDHEDEN